MTETHPKPWECHRDDRERDTQKVNLDRTCCFNETKTWWWWQVLQRSQNCEIFFGASFLNGWEMLCTFLRMAVVFGLDENCCVHFYIVVWISFESGRFENRKIEEYRRTATGQILLLTKWKTCSSPEQVKTPRRPTLPSCQGQANDDRSLLVTLCMDSTLHCARCF